MRKFLLQALLVTVIVTGISEAARVTKPYTFSAGQTIRSADVNSNFDTLYNEFNGNIQGGASGNIDADSLTETEMADDVNPRVRWDEGFQDWIYSGLQPATDAGLTSDVSAGTAYVNGYRTSKASATAHTYTNTKDTYIDIDYTGVFHYTEVVPMAAEPAVYTDSVRLAVAATRGGAITQVTDLRVLTPYSTGSSKDMITRGFDIEWTSTTTITVNPGTLYVNVTQVDVTADTVLNITSAGDAIDGVTAQQATSVWRYVYVSSSGAVKLWSVTPTFADTSSNLDGTLIYIKYGSTWYRCIGAIRLNATGAGEVTKFYQDGNCIQYDVPQTISTTVSAGAWTDGSTAAKGLCSAAIPPISTRGLFGLSATDTGTCEALSFIRPNGSTWGSGYSNGICGEKGGQVGQLTIGGQRTCKTDSSQKINIYHGAAVDSASVGVEGYFLNIR